MTKKIDLKKTKSVMKSSTIYLILCLILEKSDSLIFFSLIGGFIVGLAGFIGGRNGFFSTEKRAINYNNDMSLCG